MTRAEGIGVVVRDWSTASTLQTLLDLDGRPTVALRGTTMGVPTSAVFTVTQREHADLLAALAEGFRDLPPEALATVVKAAKSAPNQPKPLPADLMRRCLTALHDTALRLLDAGSVVQSQGEPDTTGQTPAPARDVTHHDPGDEDTWDNWKPAR